MAFSIAIAINILDPFFSSVFGHVELLKQTSYLLTEKALISTQTIASILRISSRHVEYCNL